MKVVNKSIDVICWFDSQGKPHPVRFRVVDETDANQVIRIQKIVTTDFEKLAGNKMYVFTCQCVVRGVERIVVLKYELESCLWFLFKI